MPAGSDSGHPLQGLRALAGAWCWYAWRAPGTPPPHLEIQTPHDWTIVEHLAGRPHSARPLHKPFLKSMQQQRTCDCMPYLNSQPCQRQDVSSELLSYCAQHNTPLHPRHAWCCARCRLYLLQVQTKLLYRVNERTLIGERSMLGACNAGG